MESKLAVGEKVRVISDQPRLLLTNRQFEFAGRIVTIASQCACGEYFIEEDGLPGHWKRDLFKKVSPATTPLSAPTTVKNVADDDYGTAKELIEVVNQTVTLYRFDRRNGDRRKVKDRQVALADLLNRLTTNRSNTNVLETPILPIGTRGHWRRGRQEVLVVEEPPKLRTILCKVEGNQAKFNLAFPYLVHVFYLLDGALPDYKSRIFYRTAPLTKVTDKLALSNLTHAKAAATMGPEAGAVCMKAEIRSGWPLSQKISANLDYFWTTAFSSRGNAGYNEFFTGFAAAAKLHPKLASLAAWQETSRQNPLLVLEIPWQDSGSTIGQVVEKVLGSSIAEQRTIDHAAGVADMIYQLRETD